MILTDKREGGGKLFVEEIKRFLASKLVPRRDI